MASGRWYNDRDGLTAVQGAGSLPHRVTVRTDMKTSKISRESAKERGGRYGRDPHMKVDGGLFPASARVIYQKHPLTDVICQLRFPSILRIEEGVPADFQELIRARFPLYERAAVVARSTDLPPEVVKLLAAQVAPNTFLFRTEDSTTTLSLTPDAIALSTKAYTVWEDFSPLLWESLEALVEVYKPAYYSRIGLRYQNALSKETTNLTKVPWSKLLRSELLGELTNPAFEKSVRDIAKRQLQLDLPDHTGSLLLNHGLGKAPTGGEAPYLIDLDFFTDQRTEVANAKATIENFHHHVGHAFRWCITERLHRALGPRKP